jgi:isopenicillin-N epimerase
MKQLFRLDAKVLYLNNGTHSITPTRIQESITQYQREFESNPTQGLTLAWKKIWEVQTMAAQFLSADPRDLFLRHNVSEAIGAILLGMKITHRDGEILVGDLEYGAMVSQCRYRAEKDGLRLRRYSQKTLAQAKSSQEIVDLVVSELRADTRVLLLSHVITANGLKMPIREISKITRERGVLLVVDGAHSTGAMPLSFGDFESVDFYAGNFHKWTMGPKGTGFGWVHPMHQASIEVMMAGWTTFELPKSFEGFGGGSRFTEKMLFSSCRDFAPFFALKDLFEMWQVDFKREVVFSTLKELQRVTIEEVDKKLGWKMLSPENPELRGPLVSVELPENWLRAGPVLMSKLFEDTGLQVSIAGYGQSFCLRLSPHIYNTRDEISRGVEVLKNYQP